MSDWPTFFPSSTWHSGHPRPRGKGVTLRQGAVGFDAAVLGTSFNSRDPGVRPKIIIQAGDVFDVIAAVKLARTETLQISICSGGHSWNQNHLRNGGMLLDLSRLNGIEIHASRRRAIVGPGASCGDLDRGLKKEGLFFPLGRVADIGLGGYLLQGGFGYGSRKFGLAVESVEGVDVVLADGSLVHADARENSDLYWAARGAGPGFFGVVVRFHLRLHKRPRVSALQSQVFPMRHLDAVVRWADQIGSEVARTVELQFIITRRAWSMGIFSPGIGLLAPVLADSWQEARDATAFIRNSPIRALAVRTLPLLPISMALMARLGWVSFFPEGARWCADNAWLTSPVEDVLPAIHRVVETLPPAPAHARWLSWHPPTEREDMAFSMESKSYFACYGTWDNPAEDHVRNRWAGDVMRLFEPHAKGIQLADENLANRPARFMSDRNFARLQDIRGRYDPGRRFQSWGGALPVQEVQTAGTTRKARSSALSA